jgi:hypothetical protein
MCNHWGGLNTNPISINIKALMNAAFASKSLQNALVSGELWAKSSEVAILCYLETFLIA